METKELDKKGNVLAILGCCVLICLLLITSVGGLLVSQEEDINSYNIRDREGCLKIESDNIYNNCIMFYNERGFKLGDPLIGFRK